MKLLFENWRKFLNESTGSPYRVYHGSWNAVFPAFQITAPDEKAHDFGFFGDGLYFDTSLRQALGYAGGLFPDPEIVEQNVKRIENAVSRKEIDNIMNSGAVRIINKKGKETAGVYVVDLIINNPYYWKGKAIPSIIQNPFLNIMPPDIADDIAMGLNYSNWKELIKVIDQPGNEREWEKVLALQVSKILRNRGHDGIIMERVQSVGAEIIVFEPNQIQNVLNPNE